MFLTGNEVRELADRREKSKKDKVFVVLSRGKIVVNSKGKKEIGANGRL